MPNYSGWVHNGLIHRKGQAARTRKLKNVQETYTEYFILSQVEFGAQSLLSAGAPVLPVVVRQG